MRKKYANIIVDIAHDSVDRPFQYKIPERLQEKVEIGMAVTIPFGAGNKLRKGYVMEVTDRNEYPPEKIKELESIQSDGANVEAQFIRLAGFIKRQYGSTMITALKTVLPAKQRVKTLEKRTLELSVDKNQAILIWNDYQKKHQSARARLLEVLIENSKISYEKAIKKCNITAKTIHELEQKGYLKVVAETYYRMPVVGEKSSASPKVLSASQQYIVKEIRKELGKTSPKTSLIHGITGSGKTEVYMELIAGVIQEGKQAIVLIPEIALTYQTVLRFMNRFGNRVSVLNSKLSGGEKYDQCERAKRGELDVMIGPRSALFTPFPRLGLIIMDEEHEGSYKSESMPRYHAREVAQEMARYYGAGVVLGSATPSLESYYKATKGTYRLFELTERLTGGSLPTVYTIDLRQELKEGNRTIFSRKLQELMKERLEKKEQIMLFLNRRGYAGFISCRSCGHVMKCPHCDVSLSEHKGGKLICHYCGYEEPSVQKCPKCGSKYILGFRAGTQQIEEQMKRLFPDARILRMDADTTRKKESYEQILSSFSSQEADVLVGTQMIVKGHDFPNVTLVGILAADLSLHSNDYRAGERTFQLLTQAAGRAGRGEKPGEVVIQSYQPENYSVIHAANQDYQNFYKEEILYRELLQYPPAAHMLAVLIASANEERACNIAKDLVDKVKKAELYVIGPAPMTVSRVNDIYRFVFYIKNKQDEILIQMKDELEQYIEKMDYGKENIQFDFDPMNTY